MTLADRRVPGQGDARPTVESRALQRFTPMRVTLHKGLHSPVLPVVHDAPLLFHEVNGDRERGRGRGAKMSPLHQAPDRCDSADDLVAVHPLDEEPEVVHEFEAGVASAGNSCVVVGRIRTAESPAAGSYPSRGRRPRSCCILERIRIRGDEVSPSCARPDLHPGLVNERIAVAHEVTRLAPADAKSDVRRTRGCRRRYPAPEQHAGRELGTVVGLEDDPHALVAHRVISGVVGLVVRADIDVRDGQRDALVGDRVEIVIDRVPRARSAFLSSDPGW